MSKLLESDLKLPPGKPNEEYFQNFLKTFAIEPDDVHGFQETFEKWYRSHDKQLQKIYANAIAVSPKLMETQPEKSFSRRLFFVWMFNMYLKDIQRDIEEMTAIGTTQCPKKEGEKE